LEALRRWGRGLEEVSVFAVQFDGSGRLAPANDWVAEAPGGIPRSARRTVLTAVNDVVDGGSSRIKDPEAAHAVLATPEARRRHVEELMRLSAWADGVEVDYEKMFYKDRENFTAFIRELAAALHRAGKTLSVVAEPKTTDVWKDGCGAIDWTAVGSAADAVKVMAYFEHHEGGDPGPLASEEWVARVARFALTQVPPEKLWIVLTVAGIDWPQGARGKQVEFSRIRELPGRAQRDKASGTMRLKYKDADGRGHEVWFEDAGSIERKIKRLSKEGVSRVALWRLGVGDPDIWRRAARR
jgi:spore germination protein YaaH